MNLLTLVASHSDHDSDSLALLSSAYREVSRFGICLATCNRFEIYALSDRPQALHHTITRAMASSTGLSVAMLRRSFRMLTGHHVPEHLFSVASGLDSLALGEREIAGQVRQALTQAQAFHHQEGSSLPGELVRLFQSALHTSKKVGSQTEFGKRGRSLVALALDLAAETVPLAGLRATIIGSGAYAGATMVALHQRQVASVMVYSPSGRSANFVEQRGGQAVSSLNEALAQADLVIGCSGRGRRIAHETLHDIRRQMHTPHKPLIVVDLALARDFDPEVAHLPGVTLIDLDLIRQVEPTVHDASLQQARAIVTAATQKFEKTRRARTVDPAVIALRRHTHDILRQELETIRAQYGCSAQAADLESALHRLVQHLLHIPTTRAREMATRGRAKDYYEALQVLYGISIPEQAAAPQDKGPQSCCSQTASDVEHSTIASPTFHDTFPSETQDMLSSKARNPTPAC